MKKHLLSLLPIIVFLLVILFYHTIILHKSIFVIDWGLYLIAIVSSIVTKYICNHFKE